MIDLLNLPWYIYMLLILLIITGYYKKIYDWFDYHSTRRKLKNGYNIHETCRFGVTASIYVMEEHYKNVKRKYSQKYNLDLNIQVTVGHKNDDLVNGLQTMLITLSYAKR